MRRGRTTIPAGLLVLCFAAVAAAQVMPAPPVAGPADAEPAPPDTLTLSLAGPPDAPAPVLRSAGPDSLIFGGELTVDCAFSEAGPTPLDSLSVEADWAELLGAEPVEDGFRLRLRLTRPGPYRLAWGDGPATDQVFHVVGRLGPQDNPVPVRDPRALGWRLGRLLAALLVLIGLGLFWRRLRRRGREETGEDDPLPVPAWMRAAVDLAALRDGELAARGEGRAFLHELDMICRRFLAERYFIGAVEMTPAEIRAAFAERRLPPVHGDRFASLLADCDRQRFAPVEPGLRDCRARLEQVVDAVAEVRIEARWTPVPPALEREANLAWNRLRPTVSAPTGEVA